MINNLAPFDGGFDLLRVGDVASAVLDLEIGEDTGGHARSAEGSYLVAFLTQAPHQFRADKA